MKINMCKIIGIFYNFDVLNLMEREIVVYSKYDSRIYWHNKG